MSCLRSKQTLGTRLRMHSVPLSLFPEPQTRTARMTTRQHLSIQSRKVTTCFVVDDCDDDYETFANMVDGEVSLSMEPTKQISPTPIAFSAVDTGEKNIPNIHTASDDDGRATVKAIGLEHKIQEWNIPRYDERRRLTRLSKAKCVTDKSRGHIDRHVRVCLLDTKKHLGVDATILVSQRNTTSERSPRFVARFENSAVRRDPIQIHVSRDIRRRHTPSIVETFLLLFLTNAVG